MTKFAQEIFITIILIILSIFLFYYGTFYPADELIAGGGPAFFAKIVLIILLISCLFNIANTIKNSSFIKERIGDSQFDVKSVILLVVIGAYLFTIPIIGFVLATFIFTYIGYFLITDDLLKAWKRKYILAICYAAASLLLYLIFVKLLQVVLPQGLGIFRKITEIF